MNEDTQPHLDRRACYRALASRDARFDGRFFVAVRTTGIYCRPVCRVRLPRLENVEFFACAAAAESRGFRACRRCRPESAPGSSAWLGTEATVARALRLVDAGLLDNAAVGDLADRVGVGERHLRRLFDRHLGVAPNDLALTRRLHLARRLLDDSSLKISDVALAAGFGSVRRFNDAMRTAFGFTPGVLRGSARRPGADRLRGARSSQVAHRPRLELKLAYRPPYDWNAMLAFLAPRAVAGVEAVIGDSYMRVLRSADGHALVRVTCDRARNHLLLAADFDHPRVVDLLYRGAARVFDTSADPAAVGEVLGRDALLAPLLAARPGLRVPGCWSAWEAAVRAVVGQQISVTAAGSVLARLADRFGARVAAAPRQDGPDIAVPQPAELACIGDADLDGLGLTRTRAATLRELARAVDTGAIDLGDGADPAAARASLLELRGIGPWTAEYVALRGLGDPDALPDADLGLLHALGGDGARATGRQLRARAESWRPWRSYAVVHLWNGLAARSVDGARRPKPRAHVTAKSESIP
ncbi:MAG: DNA-3-methyladenine glycosylase 2 family protein [Deltaproteobacteria bacterium]|nr:DNA-3-methyladenine glycosylase 2 family protein [Deltaproteobacteria bacterium]